MQRPGHHNEFDWFCACYFAVESHLRRTSWNHIVWRPRFSTDSDDSVDFFQSFDRQSNAEYEPKLVSLLWLLLLMPYDMHPVASISNVIDLCHLCHTLPFHSPNNAITQPMDMYCRYYYYCYFVCKRPFCVYRSTNDPNPLNLMAAVRMLVV